MKLSFFALLCILQYVQGAGLIPQPIRSWFSGASNTYNGPNVTDVTMTEIEKAIQGEQPSFDMGLRDKLKKIIENELKESHQKLQETLNYAHTQQLKTKDGEISQVRTDLYQCQQQLQRTGAQLQQTESQRNSVKEQFAQATARITSMDEELTSLKSELQTYQRDLATLKDELRTTQDDNQQFEKKLKSSKKNESTLNQQLLASQMSERNLNQQLQSTITAKNQFEQMLNSSKNNETSLHQKVYNLQTTIQKERILNTQHCQKINDTIKDYESQLTDFKSQNKQHLKNVTSAHAFESAREKKTQDIYFYILGKLFFKNTSHPFLRLLLFFQPAFFNFLLFSFIFFPQKKNKVTKNLNPTL